jgi:hypothetical protein
VVGSQQVASSRPAFLFLLLQQLLLLQDNDATLTLKEMKDSVAAIFKVSKVVVVSCATVHTRSISHLQTPDQIQAAISTSLCLRRQRQKRLPTDGATVCCMDALPPALQERKNMAASLKVRPDAE